MHFLISLFVILASNIPAVQLMDIVIAVPGMFDFDDNSLSYAGPIVDTGLQDLRAQYPQFNWSATYEYDGTVRGCPELADNLANILARWYYRKQERPAGIDIILARGMVFVQSNVDCRQQKGPVSI